MNRCRGRWFWSTFEKSGFNSILHFWVCGVWIICGGNGVWEFVAFRWLYVVLRLWVMRGELLWVRYLKGIGDFASQSIFLAE